MIDDIKKMESQLYQQERQMRQGKEEPGKAGEREFVNNPIKQKQLDMAYERGEKVV